ncbi:BppU family phage baseplate upper protein [Bacillus cereus]
MKIKLVLDINKTQQAQLNAVVTGRQGDKGTVTVNVFVVDGGVPYNLTGNTIYYEGLKPNNAYVRDTSGVKMINAAQGNFEYTFRPETFGVAGIGKRSYFSIEQGGTIRASTQDFGLVTLADAMTGNTMSGPYISELEELINLAQWLVDDINSRWTSINDQLTQLQNKLNGMDVVKRSGDTMIGNLNMVNNTGISFMDATDPNKRKAYMSSGGNVTSLYDSLSSGRVWWYDHTSQTFTVDKNTNLLKKTDYSGKDGRATLTLTADGVAWDASTPNIADRRGNTVTLRLAVSRKVGSAGDVVLTLPANMRPTMLNIQNVLANDGSNVRVMVESGGNVKVGTEGKNLYAMITYAVD